MYKKAFRVCDHCDLTLQVSEKELKKQLTREQYKTRNLENKVREARDQPSIDNTPKVWKILYSSDVV